MGKKLKGVKAINNYLNKWLKEHKFKCTAVLGTDFSYDWDNNVIYYALWVPQIHDVTFLKVCQYFCPDLKECDNFVLSFFHELGHYKTDNMFTDEEMLAYTDFVERVSNKDAESYTEWDYIKYYMHPMEIAATEWACNYIQKHPNRIKKFLSGLQPLLVDFLVKNEVELTDEELKTIGVYEDLAKKVETDI